MKISRKSFSQLYVSFVEDLLNYVYKVWNYRKLYDDGNGCTRNRTPDVLTKILIFPIIHK